MSHARRRIIFLTGAPLSSSLSWTEADLSERLRHEIAPSWRSLPLEQTHLSTGFTQVTKRNSDSTLHHGLADEPSFFTASGASFISSDVNRSQGDVSPGIAADSEEILSQFYEHSFAVHDDIASSQITSSGSAGDASFNTEADEHSFELPTNGNTNTAEVLVRSRLSTSTLQDVKGMPNAAYLRSITPQTMTVDLVVGIISISPPRTIRIRRSGRMIELVEVLVGDETRAGFNINIWLPCTPESDESVDRAEALRSKTLQIRSQDIVLFRNVALSSFRGMVHGQSLRRGMTTVDLLYRNMIDKEDVRGAFRSRNLERAAQIDPHLLKVKRVKEWVMQFVGTSARPPAPGSKASAHSRSKVLQTLPPDTQ